jgi:predicted lipoprotein with Yx(FWY)xxD motif
LRALATVAAAALVIGLVGVGTAAASTPTKKTTSTVAVATVPGVGAILVDAKGMALYTLTDGSGAAVACTDKCLTAWPPLTVAAGAKAKAGQGVTKLSATADGQVTWNSLPLYRFAGDPGPRQAKGDGLASFGGTWHVKTKASKVKSTSTTSGGGSGYGY